MDARSSRYPAVYARWQRDSIGFWGEAAEGIDWYENPGPCLTRRRASTAAGSSMGFATPVSMRSTGTSMPDVATKPR